MKIFLYIREIKNRILLLFYNFILNLLILIEYKESLAYILGRYQDNFFPYFISTNLTEIFLSFLKLTCFLSFYLSYPLLLLQITLFLMPALYKYEFKNLKGMILTSIILYISCTLITYEIFLPSCLQFFFSFELNSESSLIGIHLETRFKDYMDFFIKIFYTLNLVFHSLLLFFYYMRQFKINHFIEKRKILYTFYFIIATFFSPPDIISQFFLGVFLLLFFEAFLIFLFLSKQYEEGE